MSQILAVSKLLIKEIFRKKDFYVALILIVVVLFYASQLQFYNVKNIVRYLMEIGLALVYLFSVILTISLAARQYPAEIQNRTCHALLAKPISRAQFIFGKFLGSFFAGSILFLIFYGLFMLIASIKGGPFPIVMVVETAYLFILCLMVLSAMASGLSYYLTVGANVAVTLIVYLLINTYGPGLKDTARGFYYLLPHFEFFDLRQRFIHAWGPVSLGLVLFLTAYAVVYSLIFLTLGWLKLRKESL